MGNYIFIFLIVNLRFNFDLSSESDWNAGNINYGSECYRYTCILVYSIVNVYKKYYGLHIIYQLYCLTTSVHQSTFLSSSLHLHSHPSVSTAIFSYSSVTLQSHTYSSTQNLNTSFLKTNSSSQNEPPRTNRKIVIEK